MTQLNTLEADGRKDYASYGPVRAATVKNVSRTARSTAWFFVALLMTGIAAAAPPIKRPDLGAVSRTVETFFASQPDYQPGDLILRSQIEQVLTKLADAGARVPGAKQISERGLADDSFVGRELLSAAGKKFMRKLARNPDSFSRLDQLSSIPRGEKLIRDLIRDKDGDKMIEYLSTTMGGRKMGHMMAGVPSGNDLNKPTGRIYTVADLMAALTAAYAARNP